MVLRRKRYGFARWNHKSCNLLVIRCLWNVCWQAWPLNIIYVFSCQATIWVQAVRYASDIMPRAVAAGGFPGHLSQTRAYKQYIFSFVSISGAFFVAFHEYQKVFLCFICDLQVFCYICSRKHLSNTDHLNSFVEIRINKYRFYGQIPI